MGRIQRVNESDVEVGWTDRSFLANWEAWSLPKGQLGRAYAQTQGTYLPRVCPQERVLIPAHRLSPHVLLGRARPPNRFRSKAGPWLRGHSALGPPV